MESKTEKQKVKISLQSKVLRIWAASLLCISIAVTICTAIFVQFDKTDKDDIVIILDPGHGGSDVGAYNSKLGLYESEINLKIAFACRDALSKYDGIKVYMTHTGVGNNVGNSPLRNRVNVAEEINADIFISLHINSATNKSANGTEIYVPRTTHEPKYNEECTKLAEKILDNFKALGLKSRGVKTRKSGGGRTYTFADGTTELGDYYYVVGEPIIRFGIPGILVEHAFIDGDSDFLDSDEDLLILGKADADAIASYYGLKLKPEYENVSSNVSSDTVNSEPVSSAPEVSSQPESDTSSENFTSEENEDTEIKDIENMIKALPENPTAGNTNQIKAARTAFIALGENRQKLINADLYQKLYNTVTAYENLIHPVRIVPKSGSEISIDRLNGKLLNVETATQASGKVTVFSVMLELELYIDPSSPEEYKNESAFNYRILNPEGKALNYDEVVPNNSVVSIIYEDTVVDTLTLSIVQ